MTYYEASSIKPTVRQVDEWYRRQSPVTHSHMFGEVIYNKYNRKIKLGREKSLQQVVLESEWNHN